jgi:hypothetical protein
LLLSANRLGFGTGFFLFIDMLFGLDQRFLDLLLDVQVDFLHVIEECRVEFLLLSLDLVIEKLQVADEADL